MFRIIGLLLLAGLAQAQSLIVSPPTPSPKSTVVLDAGELVPGVEYDFELLGLASPVLLGTATPDRTGTILLDATLPDLGPGNYSIAVYAGRNLIIEQAIQITSGPSLILDLEQGSPGTVVGFEARGLKPGTAEIRFDGVRVFGPQAAQTFLSGQIEVPSGAQIESRVELINRVGRITTGVAEDFFLVLEGEGRRTVPEIRNVTLPANNLRPETTERISGQIDLPSQVLNNPDTQYSLFLEVCGDGSVVPAPRGGPVGESCVNMPADIGNITVSPDGQFSADISQPSLFFGDALQPSPTGDFDVKTGLAYANPEISGSTTFGLVSGEPLANQTFTVEVLGTIGSLNFPLENALVAVQSGVLVNPECGSPECPPEISESSGPIFQLANQVQWWKENALDFELTGLNTCPTSLYREFTDENGQRFFSLNPKQLTLGAKLGEIVSNNVPDINTSIPKFPRYFPIRIVINALASNAGPYGVTNPDGAATGVYFDMFYDVKDNRFYEGTITQALFNGQEPLALGFQPISAGATLTFALLPVDVSDALFPTQPWMPGLTRQDRFLRGDSTTPIPVFRSLVHTGQPGGVEILRAKEAEVRIKHDEFNFGVLESISLEIDAYGSNNPTVLTIEPTAPTAGNCSSEAVEYRAIIPNANVNLPPGGYSGNLIGQVGNDGPTYRRYFEFMVEDVPGWIEDGNLTDRRIIWAPEEVRLSAFEEPAMTMVTLTDLDYDIGTLRNDSQNDATIRQTLNNDGFGDIVRNAQSDNIAVNANPPVQKPDPDPIPGDGPFKVPFSIAEKTIFDSGKIPLFRYGWGIWPIAQATVGADFWFKVLFGAEGVVKLVGEQMQNSMTVFPSVQAGIDLFIDASILFDIVAVNITAIPSIEMLMVSVMGVSENNPCESFSFFLKAKYAISVGICPFCLSASDTIPLISESGNPSCQKPANAVLASSTETSERGEPTVESPSGRVAIASNARGRSLRTYTLPDGSLVTETTALGGLSTITDSIPAGELRGMTSLDVAWLSRNRAVKVWSQSSLDEPTYEMLRTQLDGPANAEDWPEVIGAQHLRYAVFENDVWSDPMTMTTPGLGEGGVQLAACQPDGYRGGSCPPGGEVLLVFSRDLDNTLTGDQRVFFSTFDGVVWSTPERLDPTSTAKEVQPDATYIDGQPVAVWVRNPSRSLADVGQRELAYRFLNTDSSGVVPVELSQGVASPSIAGDSLGKVQVAYSVAQDPAAFLGNRRNLHFATGDCSSKPCDWAELEILDDFGRKIWVERPQLTITPGNLAIIGFRHLGYGSLTNEPVVRPTDSIGATVGTGDYAMVSLQLETGLVQLDPLTDNGQIHFLPKLTYDPFLDVLEMVSIVAEVPALESLTSRNGKRLIPSVKTRGKQSRLGNGAGPALIQVPRLPDLAINSLSVVPAAGGFPDVEIAVEVENRGAAFDGTFELALTWSGPRQSGFPIVTEVLNDPGLSGTLISLSASFPEGATGDDTQTLFALADAAAEINDANGDNNVQSFSIGGVAGPEIISVRASRYADGVYLDWADSEDERVVGYRIYRSLDGQPFVAAGTTFVSGYYDMTTDSELASEYYVTSFLRNGVESSPGPIVSVRALPRELQGDSLFADGFEN